ncbi:DMT family transporter [Gordonia soli]|uniref:Putative multidrug resistance protein n=1 Tax=Gordonia soli NBRC 108243 TaxID=1223545 RepID=M0QDY4_9ACTN|nr:SMR family transporter [Gordonia soli]GAC66803.1 putative multidrug resistance protein [Gordonia soli NBRC 108243]
MIRWLLLVGAILCEVSASLALKGALDHSGLYAIVAAGYLASFAFLAMVLKRGMPLGVAYGIWGASGVALTALASAAIYDEPLTILMGIGFVLVVGGVLLVEFGSHPADSDTATATDDAGATDATSSGTDDRGIR